MSMNLSLRGCKGSVLSRKKPYLYALKKGNQPEYKPQKEKTMKEADYKKCLNLYTEFKKSVQRNDFLKYMLALGAIALAFCILYYAGKEVGRFLALF